MTSHVRSTRTTRLLLVRPVGTADPPWSAHQSSRGSLSLATPPARAHRLQSFTFLPIIPPRCTGQRQSPPLHCALSSAGPRQGQGVTGLCSLRAVCASYDGAERPRSPLARPQSPKRSYCATSTFFFAGGTSSPLPRLRWRLRSDCSVLVRSTGWRCSVSECSFVISRLDLT